jgi:hypothetical protein
VEQGIDHLVSLSPEKIPPHYAFPNLKHTLIPVEDFTGPTIAEIQKFIEITDEARREGEAVGVHCAEGRGDTIFSVRSSQFREISTKFCEMLRNLPKFRNSYTTCWKVETLIFNVFNGMI